MAKTTINNGDAGSTARAAINNNFTEVYAGQHIHNATAKTTPVDNDEAGLIDSAASNVLKKVTWANVKAALKSYFDTLYVAARSFGTAAALDVGTTANKVVQLNGSAQLPALDGSLLTGISGGGATLVRGQGAITGYSSAGSAATPAAWMLGYTNGPPADGDDINIVTGGFSVDFEFNNTGQRIPGSTILTCSDGPSAIAALEAAISAASFPGALTDEGTGMLLVTTATGSDTSLSVTTTQNNGFSYSNFGASNGTDATGPSGGTFEVQLVAGVSGKKIKIVNVGCVQDTSPFTGCNGILSFKTVAGVYIDIATAAASGALVPLSLAQIANWQAGITAGESLVWRYTGTPGVGGNFEALVIVEQV